MYKLITAQQSLKSNEVMHFAFADNKSLEGVTSLKTRQSVTWCETLNNIHNFFVITNTTETPLIKIDCTAQQSLKSTKVMDFAFADNKLLKGITSPKTQQSVTCCEKQYTVSLL